MIIIIIIIVRLLMLLFHCRHQVAVHSRDTQTLVRSAVPLGGSFLSLVNGLSRSGVVFKSG